MNFTLGIIVAVGVLVAISLSFIAMNPAQVLEPRVTPVACTLDYTPVCGADGITYGNMCNLNATKVDLAYTGECVGTLQEGWNRLTSSRDPGMGHESHQLALLLPISDKVYSGTLQYNATEPVQLVTLHGPISDGDAKGQSIWTPDGTTKYALTLVNPDNKEGNWTFAGNALAVHTKKTTPFVVDYKIDYTEKDISDTVKTGTIQSVQDPGMGHESHQIAVILEPSDKVYSGIISYSASENIQLVSLRGPIGPDEHPAKIWTTDNKTVYEMTFVDPANKAGSWEFSGNAVAIHTKNTTSFTVSYSVSATATGGPSGQTIANLGPVNHEITIPAGVSSPGCETTHQCFIPDSKEIRIGDTVSWSNSDTAAHTVTSGTPDGPDGIFDSSLFMSGTKFEFTFDKAGEYPYFCMVHPWMKGEIVVKEFSDMMVNEIASGEPSPITPENTTSAPVISMENDTSAMPTENSTASPDSNPVIPEPVPPVEVPTEKRAAPVQVTIANGASSPGCETTQECFVPYQAEIYSGEPIDWVNTDSAAHTVTSGLPAAPDATFDSGMLTPGQKYEVVLTEPGEYNYYCMLHPWMTGKVVVK